MRFKSVPQPNTSPTTKSWHPRKSERGTRQEPLLPTTVKIRNTTPSITTFPRNYEKKNNIIPNNTSKKRPKQYGHRIDASRFPRLPYTALCRTVSIPLLSILVCTALLSYMIPLFSSKLHSIESELAYRNDHLEGPLSTQTLFQSTFGLSPVRGFHSRRRLASISQRQIQHRESSLGIVGGLRQRIRSMKLALPLLNPPNGTITANAVSAFLRSQHAWVDPSYPVPRPDKAHDGYATFISIYHITNSGAQPSPNAPPLGIQSKRIHQKRQPIRDKRTIPSTAPRNVPHNMKPSRARSDALHADALRTDAINAVGELPPTRSAKSTNLKNRQEPSRSWSHGQRKEAAQQFSQQVHQKRQTEADKRKAMGPNLSQAIGTQAIGTDSLPHDLIEIWTLRSGSSLCRIYNVGRLSEGQLLFPMWMEKHSTILLHQCGIKDPIFAIKSNSNDKQFFFDKKALNMTGRVEVIDNANRDLFSASAPRHHMPHFVSDILFPLMATELLQGSGSGITKFASVRKNSSPNSLKTTTTAFPSLRPSLFLRTETWEARSSSWVQRFARYFSHPAVGFSLLSEKDRRRPTLRISHSKNNVWRFRSVLSSNLNAGEAEGLFDMNGNNFVLHQNGISGAPAWTLKGISEEPCRVSVAALTRRGPRALLNLDVLKKEAYTLFASRGLRIDFKVVNFDNIGFDAQVRTMRETNVLIATHGAGNSNLVFMRPGATFIEVFPFAYRAGPFDRLARTFRLDYKAAMSAPQTKVFKECMKRYENKEELRSKVFGWWDKAVAEEKKSPWVHRLELEKEFGEPGKSEGMNTRRCVRMQQLAFDTKAVAAMAFESAKRQCNGFRFRSRSVHGR